jgi:replicative DNA helicase
MPEQERQPRRYMLGDLLVQWGLAATRLRTAYQGGTPPGPCSGLPGIDKELCGAFSVGLHSVTGDAGAGKTAFVLQTACQCGFPAFYLSCEMQPLELLRRIVARVTGTFLGKLKTGELTDTEMMKLAKRGAASAPHLALGDARDCYAAPQWIYDQAEIVRGEAAQVLVVVDSLHSWIDSELCDLSEYERINKGIMTLRALAAELDSPVLYIAERNRIQKREGGTGSGAGSRKIEYGSETQIDLNRDMNAEPDSAGWVDVEARFVKNRSGSPNRKINLEFNGARQIFKEAKDARQ